jgi:hypothetical protein
MICPHCQADLKRKERSGQRCGRCKRTFAFDPKSHPMKLNDLGFLKAIGKLRSEAGLAYAPAQLFFALDARSKGRSSVVGDIVGRVLRAAFLGVWAGGAAFIVTRNGLVAGAVGLLVAAIAGSISFLKSRRMNGVRFQRAVIDRWREVYGESPPGLIVGDETGTSPTVRPRAALACPERLPLACLRANGLPERHGLGLLPTAPPWSPSERALLEELRARPDLPLLFLHEGDAAGGPPTPAVLAALGLDEERRVWRLGARPGRSTATRPRRRPPATAAELDRPAERAWRDSGAYSPLLALRPLPLITLVAGAVERATRPRPADPEAVAQRRARSVGFMTWPE